MAAKLPADLVKAPVFDNPLRPTAVPVELAVVPSPEPPPAVAASPASAPAVAAAPADAAPAHAPEEDPLVHRVTVRFSHDHWKALQTACHEMRMRGEHMSISEIVRRIVEKWDGKTA